MPFRSLIAAALTIGSVAQCLAQSAPATRPGTSLATRHQAQALIDRGADFLLSTQSRRGGWGPDDAPGVSAIVLKALIQTPAIGPRHPAVERGLERLLNSRRDDGGIYSSGGTYKNYESAIVLSMFAAIRETSPVSARRFEPLIRELQQFLKSNQWDESEQKPESDPFYGGAGYGRGRRPDLSNTQFMLEALHDSGLPQDDPAYKKALLFIQRCQMRGESNDQPFARGSIDGGFIYSTAGGGESKAGTVTIDGRDQLRTYGTMTYAGFKSLVYCGLAKDDPRVAAAWDWITRNWTLDANPNMPDRQSQEGLFYYYHVFARALQANGESLVRDRLGREHDWRAELIAKLAALQRSDGSWVNRAGRWMESDPTLATAYALLALEAALDEPHAVAPASRP